MSHVEDDDEISQLPPLSTDKSHENPTQTTLKKRKCERKEYEVWSHFTRFIDEDGNKKAKCNYCSKSYLSDPKKNDTSSLKAHMSSCKQKPCSTDVRQSQLSLHPIPEEGGSDNAAVLGSLTAWKFDQENCRIKLVEMVIKDELPFSIVDGEGFKEFVNALQAKFKIPSRYTISRDIYKMFKSEKEILKEFFRKTKQSVCITIDTWTSLQKLNYMCITAHFIDDSWDLKKKIINFCTIESHKGVEIGRQIDACLREWGISQVFSVTVDNASSNDVLVYTLKNKLIARDGCLGQGKFLHMRCVAHIINLVVQDGLKELNPSIKKIRDAVKFVKHSPARISRFKECCREENIESKSLLCLDVPTRWNSTYSMLEVACKFEKAFDLFEVRDPYYKIELGDALPDHVDWNNGRKMSKVLKTFFDLTVRISGSLYVTSNVFFNEIANVMFLLKEWVTGSTLDVRPMGTKMKEKFDKYWGDPVKMNKLIFFAIIIDPRFKLKFLSFMLTESYGQDGIAMANCVKEELYALYDEYKNEHQPSNGETQGQSSRHLEVNETPYLLVDKYEKQQLLEEDDLANDLDLYLNEKERNLLNVKNFDILNWWKVNEPRFPILAKLARDVLSVPVSTVASESAFSTGGRVLDPFRSSLTPHIVESLICTQDWLRKSKRPITIEEDLESIQKHEEVLLSLGIGCANEDDMEG